MLRLCYVSDAPFLGGAERYVTRLALGLDRSAFAPTVLMSDNAVLDSWHQELDALDIPVRRARMRLPFRPFDALGIVRALRALAPDVVHMNVPGPYDAQMGVVAPLARLVGAKVISTEHLPMVERLWKRALLKRSTNPFVSLVVTVSHANIDFLVERQHIRRDKCRVVYNGVRSGFGTGKIDRNATRNTFAIPTDRVGVVFLGNILPHKGLARIIRALSSIPEAPWHVVVVGEGPDEPRCREILDRSGASSRATFLGVRGEGEIEAILSSCDVLALPSLLEGLPYVILEAMACAKPVVATDVYGIPEMVVDGETGILIAPEDDVALTAALSRLIDDGDARERMGRAGRERFNSRFTLERQVTEMATLYREVAGGAHG